MSRKSLSDYSGYANRYTLEGVLDTSRADVGPNFVDTIKNCIIPYLRCVIAALHAGGLSA
jgi:hypothetical protein